MRVVVYVPSVSGQGRTRDAVARDATRLQHDVVGFASTPHDARWGLGQWKANRIACRERHLLGLIQHHPDLADRILVVRPTHHGLLLPLAGLVWLRRHPRWAAAGMVTAAVVAVLAVGRDGRERAMPPPAGPSVNPASSPAPSPPTSPSAPSPPPTANPTTASRSPGRNPPSREPAGQPTRRPAEPTRRSPEPEPTSHPASPSAVAEPTPSPVADTTRCLVDLRLPILKAKLCIGRTGD